MAKEKHFAFNDAKKFIGQLTLLFESRDNIMYGDYKTEINQLEFIKDERGKEIATQIYKAV